MKVRIPTKYINSVECFDSYEGLFNFLYKKIVNYSSNEEYKKKLKQFSSMRNDFHKKHGMLTGKYNVFEICDSVKYFFNDYDVKTNYTGMCNFVSFEEYEDETSMLQKTISIEYNEGKFNATEGIKKLSDLKDKRNYIWLDNHPLYVDMDEDVAMLFALKFI